MGNQLKVLELFAGVGGFRLGLEKSNSDYFKTYWSNQWEPATKSQDAYEIYCLHFPYSKNINTSIVDFSDNQFAQMDADLIVGGFPCQDYSVARSKKGEKGIEGQKGVLFWEIIRATSLIKPKYLILENVDRLLKSPSKQRGRDFAIMLSAFNELNYSVEWRVINAAENGGAQRRRRVFFFIYRNDTPFARQIDSSYEQSRLENDYSHDKNKYDKYIFNDGLFARQFKVNDIPKYDGNVPRHNSSRLPTDIVDISNSFSTKIWNSGIMRYGDFYSIDTEVAQSELDKVRNLGSILQDNNVVEKSYALTEQTKLEKISYLRGPKKIERTSSEGHVYTYSEGGMSPYDDVNLPARTMLTSEGTINRSTHLIKTEKGYRFLTPLECERLNDFADNWTEYKISNGEITRVSDNMRYFFMGNALVTGIIKRIGDELIKIDNEPVLQHHITSTFLQREYISIVEEVKETKTKTNNMVIGML